MPYNVGDRVRGNDRMSLANRGKTGAVTHVETGDPTYLVSVRWDDGLSGTYFEYRLDLIDSIPGEFRLGDRVRVALGRWDGTGDHQVGTEFTVVLVSNQPGQEPSRYIYHGEYGQTFFGYRLALVAPAAESSVPIAPTAAAQLPIRRTREEVTARLAEYRAAPVTGYSRLVIEQLEWILS